MASNVDASLEETLSYITDQLKALTSIASPTGYTRAATDYLMETLREMGFGPERSNKGNVLVELGGEGEPLVHIWFLTIYAEGVRYAILMAVRVMALIAGTSLLTYTTSPIVLTDAIEQLLKPLGKLHFPVHELAMMMSIALRFIPTLIEETDKIMNAQKARGAMLDSGTMTERVKALVPVLIPLFISAFRRADELAMAMECRCYRGGDGRTRLKVLRCTKQDYIDLVVCIACFAVILASRLVFPNF